MGFIENVNKAAANEPNINIAADNISDINTAAENIPIIQSVNENKANINKVVDNEPNINIAANSISDINTAADNMGDIKEVSENKANVSLVGNDLSNEYSYIEDNGAITEPVTGGTGTSSINTVAKDLSTNNTIGKVSANINKIQVVSNDLDETTDINQSDNGSITEEVTGGSGVSAINVVADGMSKVTRVYDDLILTYSHIEHAKENADIALASAQTVSVLSAQVDANTTAIANLATAQGSIVQDAAIVIDTTQKLIGINTSTPSTDSNVFEIDDANDTITFKTNASVNFFANMVFTSSTPNSRNVSIKVINTSDDAVLECFDMALTIPNGSTETISHAFLLTVGKNGVPVAPLTVRFEIVADDAGYSLDSFNSVIATSSSYDLTTEASGINYDNTTSGISATNVQDALDEALNLDMGGIA